MTPPPLSRAEKNLLALFQVIVAQDRSMVSDLLIQSPELARQALETAESFLADIGHQTYRGDTALHIAAAACDSDVAAELISHGANVSARNRRGAEPLHYASDGHPGSGRWDPAAQSVTLELLIKAGANPNSKDKSGVTPLHRAVRTRSAAAVQTLLKNGADMNLTNKSGSTPMHLANVNSGKSGSGSQAAHEQQQEIIRLLSL